MLALISLYACFYLFRAASSSTLTRPPLSALIVAFENVYDLSLLANTLSDQGIDTKLIIPSYSANDLYNNLIDVNVWQLDINIDKSMDVDTRALKACNSLFNPRDIIFKTQQFQPTFIIFPALRHDGCLLPFTKYIGKSIPVIWIQNPDEELYAFECTGVALPIHSGGFWSRLSTSFAGRSIFSAAKNGYLTPALKSVAKYLPDVNLDLDDLYSDVRLVLWGADTVLRSSFAVLTQLLVEVGCHHCRGVQPLFEDLQRLLVEYKMGTIVTLLDENYKTLVLELAKKLPQDQAIVQRSNNRHTILNRVENVFTCGNIDRQDLIGYSRTRVVLSHCADTELLEAAFHGTPVICLPRDTYESRNTARAVELGFARSPENNYPSVEEIANIVHEMHETGVYRENARKVSLAMRDRLDPAMDRLVYWLGYIARTEDDDRKFHRAKSQTRTLTEDIQFFVGLLVGMIFGIVFTGGAVVMRYLIVANKVQKSKGRYTR